MSRLLLSLLSAATLRALPAVPTLSDGHLTVDGAPFLVRGGELGNSTATNPETLRPLWPRFQALRLNTLIVPVYWDLIEPAENRFDFGALDQTIGQARGAGMRLVLLWFGSWKNSMSCYAPAWVKRDPVRFPRAVDADGNPLEILSAFSASNLEVDRQAFAALMRHLREFDGTAHTVILVQVENEVGMIPCARDHGPEAERAYAQPVPSALLAARKTSGTWAEAFGPGPRGEEVFTAWSLARYVEAVAAAGKAEYALPMYVNAALIRPGYEPGQYPSGGPLPHLFDLWRLTAPDIQILAPDIYFNDFAGWASRYRVPGNPLFIPESRPSALSGANALYAYGALDAAGFSVFAVDTLDGPTAESVTQAYDLVDQLTPAILSHQNGGMAAFLSAGPEERAPAHVRLGGYLLEASFDAKNPAAPSGGIVIATAPNEFLIGGTALTVTFRLERPHAFVGILSDEEGSFQDGHWRTRTWLGGDQTNQGRWIQLRAGRFSLQRVELYQY